MIIPITSNSTLPNNTLPGQK